MDEMINAYEERILSLTMEIQNLSVPMVNGRILFDELKDNPNRGRIDMSIEQTLSLLNMKDNTSISIMLVMLAIMDSNNNVQLSRKDLEHILNRSDKTVRNSIRTLIEHNMIVEFKTKDNLHYFNVKNERNEE